MTLALALALTFASVSPTEQPATATGSQLAAVSGTATWYRYHPGQAAAGAALRAAIGPDWRGKTVTVTANGRSITVRLTDYMASKRPGRIIDLDSRDFARLGKLSQGVLRVTVSWGEAIPLPQTDTAEPRTLAYWLSRVR